ncbi:unnamed protein product, partial [Symbiodinium necroappetens]
SRALASATRGMQNLFQLEDTLYKVRVLLRELLDHAGVALCDCMNAFATPFASHRHAPIDWLQCAVRAGRFEDPRSPRSREQQEEWARGASAEKHIRLVRKMKAPVFIDSPKTTFTSQARAGGFLLCVRVANLEAFGFRLGVRALTGPCVRSLWPVMVLASLGPVNLHLSCVEICKGLQTDSTSRLFWVVAPKEPLTFRHLEAREQHSLEDPPAAHPRRRPAGRRQKAQVPAALIRWASAAVPEQPSSINLVQPSGDKWMPHEMPLRAVSLSSSRSLPEALAEMKLMLQSFMRNCVMPASLPDLLV